MMTKANTFNGIQKCFGIVFGICAERRHCVCVSVVQIFH